MKTAIASRPVIKTPKIKQLIFAAAVADIVGTCPKCGHYTTGHIEPDHSDLVRVECVNCHHFAVYEYELPCVTINVIKTYGG